MRPTPRKSSVSKRRRPSSRLRRSRAWTFSQTGARSRSEKCTAGPPSDRLIGPTLPSGCRDSQGTRVHGAQFSGCATTGSGRETAAAQLTMDLEIMVSHGPGDRRRGEGEGQDDSEGHLVHEAADSPDAEVRGDDRRQEDHTEHHPPIEPALDQEPLERLVGEPLPLFVTHAGRPPRTLRLSARPYSISAVLANRQRMARGGGSKNDHRYPRPTRAGRSHHPCPDAVQSLKALRSDLAGHGTPAEGAARSARIGASRRPQERVSSALRVGPDPSGEVR